MNHSEDFVLHRWDDVPHESLTPLLGRRMIHGERIMLAQIFLKEGSFVPLHHHDNEQFSYILEGSMRFHVGEEGRQREVLVRAGEVIHLPSNVPHQALALEDTLSLDVFSPPRADWLDGTDAYLRNQPGND